MVNFAKYRIVERWELRTSVVLESMPLGKFTSALVSACCATACANMGFRCNIRYLH